MDREVKTRRSRLARAALIKASAMPVRLIVLGIAALSGGFLWIFTVAPAMVSLALAVAVASAWCLWLDEHAGNSDDGETGASGTEEHTAGVPQKRQGLPRTPMSKRTRRGVIVTATVGAVVGQLASPAAAQTDRSTEGAAARHQTQPPASSVTTAMDPNPGNLTMTVNFDAVSTYMFRGIRQHSTGMALWPVVDLGVAAYAGDGGVESASVNVGTWNSLHNGDTGVDGPTGKLWYESDFYTTLNVQFGGGTSLAATYTAYTSPNNAFTTVKEMMLKVAVDDSAYLGKAALKPYALVAFEFDTKPGVGQADGGSKAGRYLELGVSPGYAGAKASLAVPVKLGLSLANYYERNTGTTDAPAFEDNRFGYFSIAGLVTVPLGGTTKFGAWNLHGGVEFQALGDTTTAFNGGNGSRVVGSMGLGFSY